MDKIIEFINSQTNNKYSNLLFFGGEFNRKTGAMQIQFIDKENSKDIAKNVDELTLLCKKYLKDYVRDVRVVFKSKALNMKELKDYIFGVVSSTEQISNIDLNSVKIDFVGDDTLICIPYQEKTLTDNIIEDSKAEIEKRIFDEIKYKVTCVFEKIEQHTESSVLFDRRDRLLEDNVIFEEMKKSQVVELHNVENILGEYVFKKANVAGEIGDENEIAVVGNVKNCFLREIKPKTTEEDDASKETKKYMAFELEYENQTTRCIWFFKKGAEIPQEFEVGQTLAVFGKVDDYMGQKSIRVLDIAKCTFNEPKKVWRKCPKSYRYVKPTPYEFTEQIGLFFEDKKTDKEYLLNNTFVVYDLETTGINPETCKIIDIGAYKIVDGRIVEKFCTFVNPECEIPEEASKVNRITNAMVEDSPTIEMALPDFYKFCDGSIVVGYNNIGFDDLFINKVAKKQYYNFDNKRDDVFNIAKKNVKGLNNYKLITVCNAMNVQLIDAHRASADALATAKLFIKLVEKYYK